MHLDHIVLIFIFLFAYIVGIFFKVYVGGLDPNVTEEELRQIFAQMGDIVSVKIPQGKGCGFVQFASRYCQEMIKKNSTPTLDGFNLALLKLSG